MRVVEFASVEGQYTILAEVYLVVCEASEIDHIEPYFLLRELTRFCPFLALEILSCEWYISFTHLGD
ncbi:MAG: hypothetical protein IKV06_01390 [Alistipes sp.]|nr:hypothetical protein [Alistipes sp.]